MERLKLAIDNQLGNTVTFKSSTTWVKLGYADLR